VQDVSVAVIGGGITGQLVKIQAPDVTVYDWKPPPVGDQRRLTRAYGANYLWAPIPGLVCREFTVITHVDGRDATYDSVMAYKKKIGKAYDLPVGQFLFPPQFTPEMRGYDFVDFPKVDILYEHRITSIDRMNHTIQFADKESIRYELLVSTIPLYSLLSLLGMPEPRGRLRYDPIFFKVIGSPPDAPFDKSIMYVNYLTSANIIPYRYCDREGERHYESIVPYHGMVSSKRFIPGKIHPHDEVAEVRDILDSFGIATFGRYGAWRPDELVHETWQHIEEWNTWRQTR
jgi:hypothetical protein